MKFIVGMLVGGIMEMPDFDISDPCELVDAWTPAKARKLYNAKTKNDGYFPAHVIGVVIFGVPVLLSKFCSKHKFHEIWADIKRRNNPPAAPLNDCSKCVYVDQMSVHAKRVCGYMTQKAWKTNSSR